MTEWDQRANMRKKRIYLEESCDAKIIAICILIDHFAVIYKTYYWIYILNAAIVSQNENLLSLEK